MRGKLSEPHFDVLLFSNPGEKVWKARKTMGQIGPTVFLHFMTFSPQLETNNALQCCSDSFPHMVMYILYIENRQHYISTQSCLPIAGRLFYNVRKCHAPKVSEWNWLVQKLRQFSWIVDFACWWSCIEKGLCTAWKYVFNLFQICTIWMASIENHSTILQNINLLSWYQSSMFLSFVLQQCPFQV